MRPREPKAASALVATALAVSLALGGAAWARAAAPAKVSGKPAVQPAPTARSTGKKQPGAVGRAEVRPAKGDRGAKSGRHQADATAKHARAAEPQRPGKSREEAASGHGGPADEIPRPEPGDRDRDRITRMQDTLTQILHNRTLGRLHVGLRVMAARTGRLFYDRRGEALMDPASNQKVLATTAALMRLGGNWRYRTEVSGPAPDDDGVVHGNVYVRGNGDPTLRSADLEQMAFHLRAVGITRIEGGVVADARLLGHDAAASDEDDSGDTKAPLVVDRGMTVVRVRPGAAPGSPPLVLTEQRRFADDGGQNLGFAVRNQATTRASGRTRISVRVESAGGRVVVAVSGRIAAGAASVAFRRRVPRPALHTAAVLRTALTAAGIGVQEGASAGPTPAVATVLGVHESEPLTIVLRRINKDSDNEQAERVLQTVGAEVFGAPATTEKGVAVLRNVIGSLGLKPNSYVPRNGSGLGHANRITADAMAELLRALYLDPRIGPEILQSLSVGGVDGTTRNRFKGTLASRRVRAKTGTLDGKSCLSGLVGDGDDVVAFSMLVQGFRGRNLAAVRASQVGAVNAIMRYVRERTGEHIELPPGFDEQVAGTDVETAGEESDAEGEVEVDPSQDLKLAPGEDAIDAYLRQTRVQSGAGGAGGRPSTAPAPFASPGTPQPAPAATSVRPQPAPAATAAHPQPAPAATAARLQPAPPATAARPQSASPATAAHPQPAPPTTAVRPQSAPPAPAARLQPAPQPRPQVAPSVRPSPAPSGPVRPPASPGAPARQPVAPASPVAAPPLARPASRGAGGAGASASR